MTVSGWTIIRTERQSAHTRDNHTQKPRSTALSFGRFLAEAEYTDLVPERQISHLGRRRFERRDSVAIRSMPRMFVEVEGFLALMMNRSGFAIRTDKSWRHAKSKRRQYSLADRPPAGFASVMR